MTWPTWLQNLADAYLRDEASVFLLHGPGVDRGPGSSGDRTEALTSLLTRFLSRTRPIVGVLPHRRALTFPGIGDVGHFERLIAASALVAGTDLALRDDVPEQAVAKIWIALSSADPSQAYIIDAVHTLAPSTTERRPLPGDTPQFDEWATAERIRKANHIVLLITTDLQSVHREVIAACHAIRVPGPESTHPVPADAPSPEPEAERLEAEAPEPGPETGIQASAQATATDLQAELEAELGRCLSVFDEAHRHAKVPVLAAVASVVGRRLGEPGELEWSLDDHGHPCADGPGGAPFLERWRSDIALDAAASRLIGAWEPGTDTPLDPIGLRVLAKRLRPWLEP